MGCGAKIGQKQVPGKRGKGRPEAGHMQGAMQARHGAGTGGKQGGSGEKRNGSRERRGRVAWQLRGWWAAGWGIVNTGAGTACGWRAGGYRGSCRKPFAVAWSGEPVRLRGLEWGRKHTRWAYTHALDTKTPEGRGAVRAFESGGQGRNRTTDTRIFSPLLCQLSYLARGLPAHTGCSRERDYRRNCPPVKRLPPFMLVLWPGVSAHPVRRGDEWGHDTCPLQKSTRRHSQPGRAPVYCPHEYM